MTLDIIFMNRTDDELYQDFILTMRDSETMREYLSMLGRIGRNDVFMKSMNKYNTEMKNLDKSIDHMFRKKLDVSSLDKYCNSEIELNDRMMNKCFIVDGKLRLIETKLTKYIKYNYLIGLILHDNIHQFIALNINHFNESIDPKVRKFMNRVYTKDKIDQILQDK